MNGQDHNDPIASKAKALFDRASARLDTATANRLRLMRRDAQASTARRSLGALLPIGATAAAVLAVGIAWWLPRGEPVVQPTPAVAIEAAQDAYLTDEDADVYDWLAEAPVATDAKRENTL